MKVYAHRGLHHGKEHLENSRRAVENALVSSADGLEVDLQTLADGRFLLYHDDELNPEYFEVPRPIPLATMTVDEVRDVSNVDLLTFSEVLELDWNSKTIVFECKASRNRLSYARALERILSARTAAGNLMFSTQDWQLLNRLRQRVGDLPLAPVLSRLNSWDRHRAANDLWHELHLDQDLCTAKLLGQDKELRPERIVAWTVNDPENAQKLERIGIKGIITDTSNLLS